MCFVLAYLMSLAAAWAPAERAARLELMTALHYE
jgi:ABC-type lipoprotein release transport system permease subunit